MESETKLDNALKQHIAIACIVGAGLLWGCMGILVRSMNAYGLQAMEVVTFRSIVTAVCMLAGMLLFKQRELKIRLRDIWCFIGTGIVSVVFFNLCYFSCMRLTSLSTAAIMLYTAPTFVMIMSFFLFKESITWKKGIALIMAFSGCILVSGGFGQASIGAAGILTGLGAGIGYALYSIFGRYALERGYSSFTITTYTFVFATIGSVPFCDMKQLTGVLGAQPQLFAFSALMTILTTVVAYLLYTKGLAGIETGKAAIIASVEPVMASVVGAVLYHETLQTVGVIGMLLVLGSTVVCNLKGRNAGKRV